MISFGRPMNIKVISLIFSYIFIQQIFFKRGKSGEKTLSEQIWATANTYKDNT